MDGVASIPLGFHSEEHGYDSSDFSLSAGKVTMLVVRMSIIWVPSESGHMRKEDYFFVYTLQVQNFTKK